MIRTQIQLDEQSYTTLRERALRSRRSMAACIRTAITQYLREADTAVEDLSGVAGQFRPLPADSLVKAHDRQWAEATMAKRKTP